MISKLLRALLVTALVAAVAAGPVAARIPPPDPPGLDTDTSEPVATSQSATGVDLADAAIGAGTVIGLLLIAGTGTILVRRTRAAHGA